MELMETIVNHPSLEEINLQNINVPIKYTQDLDTLYGGIIGITKEPTKLKKIVICQAVNQMVSAFKDELNDYKLVLVNKLRDELPNIQHLKI